MGKKLDAVNRRVKDNRAKGHKPVLSSGLTFDEETYAKAKPLFQLQPFGGGASYDVAPDGQRFLVKRAMETESGSPLTLVVNWPAELKNP